MFSKEDPLVCKDPGSSYSNKNNVQTKKWKKQFFLFYYVIPAIIIIISAMYIFYECVSIHNLRKENDYGIIVDVGSRGTRLYLFQWLKRKYTSNLKMNTLTKPNLAHSFRCKYVLSEVPLEQIHKILELLIENVKETLLKKFKNTNKKNWENYPIYIQATAGMRNLDPSERDARMRIIRLVLSNKELNPFQFHNDYARVISGEEEGIYGWLSVNNALNTIFDEANNTYGAIELGGSSTQLTFFPVDTSILEDFNGIYLNNTLIRLYSHSFIGYGYKDAFFRLCVHLILRQLQNVTLRLNKMEKEEMKGEEKIKEKQEEIDKEDDIIKRHQSTINNISEILYENFKSYTNEVNERYSYNNAVDEYNEHSDDQTILNTNFEDINDTHKYTYNINMKKPYYVENFIKKIKNFKRNTKHDTTLLVQNPCFPYPLKIKIMLPTFNLTSENFIIVEKRHTFIEGEEVSNETLRDYIENENNNEMLYGTYVLPQKKINPHVSLWEALFSDFKSTSYFKNVMKSEYLNNMNENEKEELLKIILKKNTIRKNKETYVNFTVEMVGSNNTSECFKMANKLFYRESCFLSSCSFNGVYQPQLKGNQFVVYGQFDKVFKNLGFKKKVNLQIMKEMIEKYCDLAFSELKNKFGTISNNKGKTFCWRSIWSYALLKYGFKFTDDSKLIILKDGLHVDEHEDEMKNESEDEDEMKNESEDEDEMKNENEDEHERENVSKNSTNISDEETSNINRGVVIGDYNLSDTNNQQGDVNNFMLKPYFYKKKEMSKEEEAEEEKKKLKNSDKLHLKNTAETADSTDVDTHYFKGYHEGLKIENADDFIKNKAYGVTWTQGYMIYQVNFFPKYIDFRKSEIRWTILLATCLIFIMIIIMLIGYITKLKEEIRIYKRG